MTYGPPPDAVLPDPLDHYSVRELAGRLKAAGVELPAPAESKAGTSKTSSPASSEQPAVNEDALVEKLRVQMQEAFAACNDARTLCKKCMRDEDNWQRSLPHRKYKNVDKLNTALRLEGQKYLHRHIEARLQYILSDRSNQQTLLQSIAEVRQAAERLRAARNTLKLTISDAIPWGSPGILKLKARTIGACQMVFNLLKFTAQRYVSSGDKDINIHADALEQYADKCEQEVIRNDIAARKPPAPPRRKFEAHLQRLSTALDQAVAEGCEHFCLYHQADEALSKVCHCHSRQIEPPQKPTAEEVSRYICRLENWCKDTLSAERCAADIVPWAANSLFSWQATLKAANQAWRRISYLRRHAVEPELEALLVVAPDVLEKLKVNLLWQRKVWMKDGWQHLKLDCSKPVTTMADGEAELMESLRQQIKNVAIAVANKENARRVWKHCDHVARVRHSAGEPTLDLPGDINDFDFDKCLKVAIEHTKQLEAGRASTAQQEARQDLSFAAYQGRCEIAGQVASQCARLADAIEENLKDRMCDELRVAIHMAWTLEETLNNF